MNREWLNVSLLAAAGVLLFFLSEYFKGGPR
jgi:hypothetical protein